MDAFRITEAPSDRNGSALYSSEKKAFYIESRGHLSTRGAKYESLVKGLAPA
jgi:hypothetical protein